MSTANLHSAGTNAASIQFESPPRHFGEEATATDSMDSAAASQGEGHPAPLLSTPVRENIARIKSKHDDPHFDHEETVDGVHRFIYKPMGPFTKDVPVEEVKQLISISNEGLTWVPSKGNDEGPHCRSNMFRRWILPLVPSHLALAFDQPILFQISKDSDGPRRKQGGRPRSSPFVVGMKGKCSAKSHGCPSEFLCGFTEDSIKTLLGDPCPETISLSVEVKNACMHLKGETYGQLRGPARGEVIEDFISANQQPAEYAKSAIQKATDSEFHSNNLGAVVTKSGAQNISREAKEKKIIASGLTKCKLSNVPRAQSITNQQDLNARARISDPTTDFLGIVRKVELCPHFRLVLYTKPCMQLFQQLAKGGQLVLNCDSTGNLLNFPSVEEWRDKILHTKLVMNPKYPVINGKHTRDKQVSRMLSPLTIAEMASNKNAAGDICDFLMGFLTSVREAFPDEETERPLICMTDCSPQLERGLLLTFSSGEGEASTRIEYGNIVLLHLLFYDKALSDIASGIDMTTSQKELASHILKSLRVNIGIFLKECRSHVYCAPYKWMRRHKSNEFAMTKSRFEGFLKNVFYKVTEEPQISVAIVQLSLVVALLETEKFESLSFDDTMETKDCRGPLEKAADERMLQAIASFIHVESKKLHIQSIGDVRSQLVSNPTIKSKHILLHNDIIDRAKELMKGQCRMYLRALSVSNDCLTQMMGTVRCSITYGRSLVGNGSNMEPWFQGGFDLTLQLPHNGQDGIANPLYSQTVATYLRATWMPKFSLWCCGIINLIEMGMDMQIEANNQFTEAIFKYVKHNTDIYNHVSEPGEYIIHRNQDSDNCTRQFIHQYETVHGKINKLMSGRAKRKHAVINSINAAGMVEDTATLPTQDELTQQAEDAATEPWSRRGSPSEIENKLRNELVDTFLQHKESIGGSSFKKQHEYLEACIGQKRISCPTFRDFMKNTQKSSTGLSIKHRHALQEFVNQKRQSQVTSLNVPTDS